MSAPVDLVFIHGMYMTGRSWEAWAQRATGAGFTPSSPSWPFHDGEPSALRAAPADGLGKLRFLDVVDHHKRLIDAMPARPSLIGHSIGGLVVQRLVNDGYAKAAVAISSAPARGVISFSPHFLRANFPHINPFAGNAPVAMSLVRFHYAFGNTMTRAESDAMWETYAVPESRNVPRSTITSQGRIDFRRAHVPLLFIGGDHDHLTPLDAVRRNARRYGDVDVEVMPGRCHALCNQKGWEEIADRAFAFLRTASA